MRMHTFKGGTFPPEKKELSKSYAIEDALQAVKTVTIPVTQGIGKPNSPIVKIGDTVAKGQVIAKSDEYMSAPVHASIAGTVKKIEAHLVTGNIEVPCIVIQSDGSDNTAYMEPLDPFTCSNEQALQRIKDAGIVGMGGAQFPSHVKLNVPEGKEVEYVLLNACECEPYITVDHRTLLEETEKVIDGLAIELKMLGAYGFIVIEDNKLDTVPVIQKVIDEKGYNLDMEIFPVKTKYPQGSEKNIIKTVLKREIPFGKLPNDCGAVITNVNTAVAISDAFRLGKPLVDRPVTISGGAVETPKNIRVPIGTIITDLIPSVVQLKEGQVAKIISGGPMMGHAMANTDFPIAKGCNSIVFMAPEEICTEEETHCIGCGQCYKVCTLRLSPVMILRSLKAGNLDDAISFGLLDCCECGSCAYVCPAHKSLVQKFRLGKALVRARDGGKK